MALAVAAVGSVGPNPRNKLVKMTVGDLGRAKSFADEYARLCAKTRPISRGFMRRGADGSMQCQVTFSQVSFCVLRIEDEK